MSRLQLALNVADLEASIDFYSKLFGVEVAKRKPGYANFEVTDPPLKLVLFEGGEDGSINHLGVETEGAAEVEAAEARLTASGLLTTGIDDTICCYAEKVETWVTAPDGNRWEWYVKTADADSMSGDTGESAMCCAPAPSEVSMSTRSPITMIAGGGSDTTCEPGGGCC